MRERSDGIDRPDPDQSRRGDTARSRHRLRAAVAAADGRSAPQPLGAIGAASFVIFADLIPGESSPTRVAAQVVSGIGFLGAGIIFREGLQVTGLNTAATLWCSAAVGLLAGSGHPLHACAAAGFVILVNLLLRPLVRLINRQPIVQAETDFHYKVRVVCRSPEE